MPELASPDDRSNVSLVIRDNNEEDIAVGSKGTKQVVLKGLKPNTTYLEGEYNLVYQSDNGISGYVYVPTFTTAPRLMTGFTLQDTNIVTGVGADYVTSITDIEPADTTDQSINVSVGDKSLLKVTPSGTDYVIHSLKAGETDITYTSNDGSNIIHKQHVVVKPVPEKPQNIKVSNVTTNTASISAE